MLGGGTTGPGTGWADRYRTAAEGRRHPSAAVRVEPSEAATTHPIAAHSRRSSTSPRPAELTGAERQLREEAYGPARANAVRAKNRAVQALESSQAASGPPGN